MERHTTYWTCWKKTTLVTLTTSFSFVQLTSGTTRTKTGLTKDSAKFYPLPCDQDSVDDFLTYIVDNVKGTNSLIVLDDCAATQTVKNRVSELVKLAFSARHYELSTIVITQQMTSIAKPYRENIPKLVTFYNPSKRDIQIIADEFLSVTKEESTNIVQKLKNNKYAKLEVLLHHPYTHSVIHPLSG